MAMETKAARLLRLTHSTKHSEVSMLRADLNENGAMKDVQVESHKTEKMIKVNRELRNTPHTRKRNSMQLSGSANAANQQPIRTKV